MKRGIYKTIFGHIAFVSGPQAKIAWDLSTMERIPIEHMTANLIWRLPI